MTPAGRTVRSFGAKAVYRLVAHFRREDLIFTHLSARVPGPEHHFLINPYGMTFDELKRALRKSEYMRAGKISNETIPALEARLKLLMPSCALSKTPNSKLRTLMPIGLAILGPRGSDLTTGPRSNNFNFPKFLVAFQRIIVARPCPSRQSCSFPACRCEGSSGLRGVETRFVLCPSRTVVAGKSVRHPIDCWKRTGLGCPAMAYVRQG